MSDLISREQALNAVEWDTEAYTAINMLPSVDAVPQWIPVENGLPKEGQRVVVTIQWINGNRTVYDTNRDDVTCWRGLGRDVNIIAWMPLPKPYEAERKE